MHRSYYCKVYHWSTVSGCFEFFSKCATKYTMDFLVLEMCYYITICQNTASKDYNVSTEIGIQPYSLNGYLKVCLRKGLQQIKKLYRKKNTIMNEYDMFSSWCQLSAVLFSCLYFCFILYSPSCEVALLFFFVWNLLLIGGAAGKLTAHGRIGYGGDYNPYPVSNCHKNPAVGISKDRSYFFPEITDLKGWCHFCNLPHQTVGGVFTRKGPNYKWLSI